MNKILLGNFPYFSQHVTANKQDDPAFKVSFVHGFNFAALDPRILYPQLAGSLFQAILVHDVIAIDLQEVDYLVRIFGFADALKLLQSGCIEIINDGGFTSALRQIGKTFEVIFVTDGSGDAPPASLTRFEKKLRRGFASDSVAVNSLLLQIEQHQKIVVHQDATEALQKEIDYDLRNQNLTTAQRISSKERTEILPTDVYKILRLLFINKSLYLSSLIGALSLKVDGAIEPVLNEKLSPVFRSGHNPDATSLFYKILQEKRIPDLVQLYWKGIITIEQVLALRDDVHGQRFRDWFLSTLYDPQIVREILLSRGAPKAPLTTFLRFIVPNAIGIANTGLGIAASALDSFLVEKILGGWHPNIFLDDVLRLEIDSCLRRHEITTRRASIKARFPNVGRNDPCPCHSGKKFKRCCGNML